MATTLATWDPFTLVRDFDRLLAAPNSFTPGFPRMDVFDREGALLVRTEVPGVDPDAIDVTVENGTLTIAGSRSFSDETTEAGYHRKETFEGEFKRTVLLPESLDLDAVTATSKDGILEVRIPRLAEVLPKKVKVELES